MDETWQDNIEILQNVDKISREILNVSSTATDTEIKKAFRKKALHYHPDVNQNKNSEQFQLVCCSYKFLVSGEICHELINAYKNTEKGESPESNWKYWCWWINTFFE